MRLSVLAGLTPGKKANVVENCCGTEISKRLEDLGLIPGAEVVCLHRSPAGSPAAYDIQGAVIALRRQDAAKIWVEEKP